MNYKNLKKFILLVLCLAFQAHTQAFSLSQWLLKLYPEFKTQNSLYLGLGALALTGTGIASYLWYKNYYQQPPKFDASTGTFQDWKNSCTKMRSNTTVLKKNDFKELLIKYLTDIKSDKLFTNKKNWVENNTPQKLFTALQQNKSCFDPYVQKVVLKPGSEIAFHGDIHGDVDSLNNFIARLENEKKIDNFTITQDNFYMVFLGDYTDRGPHGPEVIYTILRLKLANPDKVFLVRGNHEDAQINENYGFYDQLKTKFNVNPETLMSIIERMYETLPLALFLGCGDNDHHDFILCCHGGAELGFDAQQLLDHPRRVAYTKLGTLKRADQFSAYQSKHKAYANSRNSKSEELLRELINYTPKNITTIMEDTSSSSAEKEGMPVEYSALVGFQWNDTALLHKHIYTSERGAGFIIGKKFNRFILENYSTSKNIVQGVFRAHQHVDPEMVACILNTDEHDHACNAGVGKAFSKALPKLSSIPQKLWHNIVCTFSVCPGAGYEQFTQDTYGILTVKENYDDWRLEVIQQVAQ